MDFYYPKEKSGAPLVILVAGYPDEGFERIVGRKYKDTEAVVAWAQRIASAGMIAVTYSNREPAADLDRILTELGAQHERIGLFASSGNAPLALSRMARVRCAALLYPYLDDVPEAARKYGFVVPEPIDDVDVPLLLVRAGGDAMPGLNDALDRYVARALARNAALTLLNYASAPHAFDLTDSSVEAQYVIDQTLAFLRVHLF